MFVTYVEGDGPFVRLWVQEDPRTSSSIETALSAAAPRLAASPAPPPSALVSARVFAARIRNGFYRARLAEPPRPPTPLLVRLLDFGNEEEVGPDDLRLLDGEAEALRATPPQASDFFLSRAVHPQGQWEPGLVDHVRQIVYYKEAVCVVELDVQGCRFASVRVANFDLADYLVKSGIALRADPHRQAAALESLRTPAPPPAQQSARHQSKVTGKLTPPRPLARGGRTRAPLAYKTRPLEVGSEHSVRVTHSKEGPELFAVRLESEAEAFAALEARIASCPLESLTSPAAVGDACLGRPPGSQAVARAVVTGCTASQCSLFFVDLGFGDSASSYDVYRIPDELVAPDAFAARFCLSGFAGRTSSAETRRAFSSLVDGKRLALKVAHPEGPPLIQYGELRLDGVDLKRLLVAEERYPDPPVFVEDTVTVAFVDSCTKFFVQLTRRLNALEEMMREVQLHCERSPSLAFHEVRPGAACCALFPEDDRWYRARISNIKKDKVVVYYVDYGNEQELSSDSLKPVSPRLLGLEAQAVQCALKGFESRPFDVETSRAFESLTLERDLRATVRGRIRDNVPLIDLVDESQSPPVNVAVLLSDRPVRKVEESPPKNLADQDMNENIETQRSNDQWQNESNHQPEFENKRNKFLQKPKDSGVNNNRQNRRKDRESREYKDKPANPEPQNIKGKPQNVRKKNLPEPEPRFSSGAVPKRGNRPREYNNQREYNNDRNQGNNTNSREERFQKNSYSNKPNYNENKVSTNDMRLARARGLAPPVTIPDEVPKPKWNHLKNPAALGSKYKQYPTRLPHECDVTVSWYINPGDFYVQITSLVPDFERMMMNLSNLYRGVQPLSGDVPIGSSVVAQFPEDRALYRATVLKIVNSTDVLVQYVDFGNRSVVKKKRLWQLESELLDLPAISVRCTLSGVFPIKKWSTNTQEDRYFKESKYICTFHSENSKVFTVTLNTSDNQNVSQLLIENGLARSTEKEEVAREKGELVDANMIIGQCFYAHITKIETLSKFYVCLNPPHDSSITYKVDISPSTSEFYCNQSIECSLWQFDETKCKISNEEFKKQYEKKGVLLYIDNVAEQSLIITLYNFDSGQRLDFFPDENAIEYIPRICPHPVFNKSFGNSYVSHIESVNEIYLQRNSTANNLTKLIDSLYQIYEGNDDESKYLIPEVDSFCSAKCSDGNWYRARVLKKLITECQIHYIDYGNKELVSVENLKTLDSQFYNMPEQALLCSLEVSPFEVDVDDVKSALNDKELQVELSISDIGWVSAITVDGRDAINILKDKSKSDDKLSVYVSHIDSPGQFWLQLTSDISKLESLSEKLQDVSSLDDLKNYEVGTECVAKYSADELYYRAVILDSDSDISTVRFIDYGNTDVLANQPGVLKCIPKEFTEIPVYAMKCSVNATPAGIGEWTEQASNMFTKLVGDNKSPVYAKIILKDAITYVDLYVKNLNITNELVKSGFATSTDKQNSGSLPTCYASHVNSPSEFWIQLESAVTDLESLSEKLTDAENFSPITEIEEDVICAAKFPEDGCWYRAKIISHGSEGTEVLFMDYGNASLTTDLRSLPENLKELPTLSRKCALQKPPNIENWCKEAELKFFEITAEGATVFEVTFIASGDTSVIDLFHEKKSVTEQLVTLQNEICSVPSLNVVSDDEVQIVEEYSDVHISHCHGPDDFWVQYNSNKHLLDSITQNLHSANNFNDLEEVEDGGLCVSLFSEDNTWYRSIILDKGDSGVEVRHIDYGTTTVTNTLKEMPSELRNILPLAVHCSLFLPSFKSFNEKNHEMFLELAARRPQVFHLEKVDSDVDPVIVNLFVKNTDDTYANVLKIIGADTEKDVNACISDLILNYVVNAENEPENVESNESLDEASEVIIEKYQESSIKITSECESNIEVKNPNDSESVDLTTKVIYEKYEENSIKITSEFESPIEVQNQSVEKYCEISQSKISTNSSDINEKNDSNSNVDNHQKNIEVTDSTKVSHSKLETDELKNDEETKNAPDKISEIKETADVCETSQLKFSDDSESDVFKTIDDSNITDTSSDDRNNASNESTTESDTNEKTEVSLKNDVISKKITESKQTPETAENMTLNNSKSSTNDDSDAMDISSDEKSSELQEAAKSESCELKNAVVQNNKEVSLPEEKEIS